MKLMKTVKEYWRVFNANIYDKDRMKENMHSMQNALLILTGFSFVLAIFNVLNHEYGMLISSLMLN